MIALSEEYKQRGEKVLVNKTCDEMDTLESEFSETLNQSRDLEKRKFEREDHKALGHDLWRQMKKSFNSYI